MDAVEYTVVLKSSAVKDSGEMTHAGLTEENYQVAMLDQTAPAVSTYQQPVTGDEVCRDEWESGVFT